MKNTSTESEIAQVSKQSINISNEMLIELQKVLPHIFHEGKIDFDEFKLSLGENIDDNDERYSFNWAGRKESFKNIQNTAKGTLTPSKEESLNFDSSENIFIEGDNLEVLKLLYKSYFNKVKMIYIDPPYNTGNDLVYKDDFKNSIESYLEQTGQIEGGKKLTTNTETKGRFHSDWLSMIYPRLFIARNLLKDDGVFFVSIGEIELANLKILLNEIFGEENYLTTISRITKAGSSSGDQFSPAVDYILVYAKDKDFCPNFIAPYSDEQKARYDKKDDKFDKFGPYLLKGLYQSSLKHSGSRYFIQCPDGSFAAPPENKVWRWNQESFKKGLNDDRIVFNKSNRSPLIDKEGNISKWNIYTKTYLYGEEGRGITPKNYINEFIDKIYNSKASRELSDLKIPFDYPKPSELIKYLTSFVVKDEDIILDFFAGSGTTAHGILDLNEEDNVNRKFILVQLPEKTKETSEAYRNGYETISEICKERIRRVINRTDDSNQNKLINNSNIGFKVFKLAQSNYKIWEDYDGDDLNALKEQLSFYDSPLVADYNNIDVIYEVILKEGFDLNSNIERMNIEYNVIYKVSDANSFFYICLDPVINEETINSLFLEKEDIFICIDNALDDTKKSNLALQCNLKTL